MPLNALIAVGMVGAGLGVGFLGRWSAPRIADALSDSDHYMKRTTFHKKWSEDRVYRHYHAAMGAPSPFESRVLPVWLDKDGRMVNHYLQYKLTQWREGKPVRNANHTTNEVVRIAYEAYDMTHADTKPRSMV